MKEVENYMRVNPQFFATEKGREIYCRANNFLPVYDKKSYPTRRLMVYPSTQFACTAYYKKEVFDEWKKGGWEKTPRRIAANLIPTAFVFEADGATIKEQAANIRQEALRHVLSITHSGNKSLHFVVPIHIDQGKAFDGPDASALFKAVWEEVAAQLFFDTSMLDSATATIGRLTRMPGAKRLPTAKDGRLDTSAEAQANAPLQRCYFLNTSVEYLDIRGMIERARESLHKKAVKADTREAVAAAFAAYAPNTYEDDMRHLENSQRLYPSAHKQIILDAFNGVLPSSGELPMVTDTRRATYLGAIALAKSKFGNLARPLVEAIKAAHPSCLPLPVESFL